MNESRILSGICSVLCVVAIAVGTRSCDQQDAMRDQQAETAATLQLTANELKHLSEKVDTLAGDSAESDRQRLTDTKHWRYLGHLHAELNKTNHAAGLPPIPAPKLGNE